MTKRIPSVRQQVLTEGCPEFEALERLELVEQRVRDNDQLIARRIDALRQEKEALALKWHQDNSLANFEAYLAASNALRDAERCKLELPPSGAQAYQQDPANIRILQAALRVARDRLAKRISALNNEERARLEAAGVDHAGAEHPSITTLKAYLTLIADAIIGCEGFLVDNADGVSLSAFRWQIGRDLLKA